MTFLRIAISIALIVILLYIMRSKYGQIVSVLKEAKLPILCVSFVLTIGAITILAFRLMLIMTVQGINMTFRGAVSLTFIGYFFNNFLPTSIGGDVVKAYYISKKGFERMTAFTSVFIDRILGLFTMVAMAFIALLFANNMIMDKRINYTIYAIIICTALLLIFIMNKNFAKKFLILFFFTGPIRNKLKEIYSIMHRYKYHKVLMGEAILISVLSQSLSFLSFWILLLSINADVPIKDIFLRMPIISILSLLPSLNGLGLREGATVILFGPLISSQSAFAASMLGLLALFLASIVGGLIYIFSPQFKLNAKGMDTFLNKSVP